MKYTLAVVFLLSSCSAYTPKPLTRRSLVSGLSSAFLVAGAAGVAQAEESLLSQFGNDSKNITPKASTRDVGGGKVMVGKSEGSIDPNLRANYYYPTARKRYLPRIKKASDEISTVPDQIAAGNWDAVNIFVTKTADDAVLPMKLYTSSLGGQGLNLKVAYLNDMSKAAETFDKNNLKLAKAAKKKDTEAAAAALGEMSVALTTYRTQGKLLGPDGGGDIPSVEDIRRSACRVQGRSFEQKVKDRDARLAQEMTPKTQVAKK